MSVIITPSKRADAERIAELEALCFSDPWSRESIEGSIDAEAVHCFSALDGDVLVGYGFIGVVADESEILNLAVSPDARRRGIGEELMRKMLSCAKELGAATAYLEVRHSNEGAIRLYEKSGFAPIGVRKNYYRYPTEDAVIMASVISHIGDKDDNLST